VEKGLYAFLFVSVGFLGISENGLGGIHGNQHEVKTKNPAMPIQPPLNRRNRLLLARAVWCCEPTSFVSKGFETATVLSDRQLPRVNRKWHRNIFSQE
jgi:hypothetical protein